MIEMQTLVPLIILFFVIIDPLASFTVFFAASRSMKPKERSRTALHAVILAGALSLSVILLGENLLRLFSTTIDEFKVAGGIILGILGMKMALGQSLTDGNVGSDSSRAVAAILATPLLTGPAAITSIIISVHDYGMLVTGIAVGIVLALTAVLFFQADRMNRVVGRTTVLMMSTMLGLITLAWGVKYVADGVKAILFLAA